MTLKTSIEALHALTWLSDGHVQAVLDGGADRAWITRLSDGRFESRSHFADRATYERYDATVAPDLRANGVA